jgi:alkyl hydroperoxide reductase subunit AhpC
MLFSAEEETGRGTDIVDRNSQFRYAITNALHIYRTPAKFLAFLQTVQPTSLYCPSGQHNNPRCRMADTYSLSSKRTDFKHHVGIQSF